MSGWDNEPLPSKTGPRATLSQLDKQRASPATAPPTKARSGCTWSPRTQIASVS